MHGAGGAQAEPMRGSRVVSTTVEEVVVPALSGQAEALLTLHGALALEGTRLVVHRDGVVLGVATVRLSSPTAELLSVLVDPNHRHRGLGRRLIAETVRRARIAGCTRLWVHLPRTADGALGFFRHLGFEDTHVALDLRL